MLVKIDELGAFVLVTTVVEPEIVIVVADIEVLPWDVDGTELEMMLESGELVEEDQATPVELLWTGVAELAGVELALFDDEADEAAEFDGIALEL